MADGRAYRLAARDRRQADQAQGHRQGRGRRARRWPLLRQDRWADGALRACHTAVQYALVRECTRAGLQVSAEVYGLFTRDLRQAEWVRLEAYRNDRRREQQGIVPDLKVCLNPERICELKGIRSDSTHTNYNGAEVTGVAKRELTIPVEVVRQAVKLDERVFGVVAPAVGPWQRRLLELGGVRPLAFGQYGEWGAGFEELVRDLSPRWGRRRRRIGTCLLVARRRWASSGAASGSASPVRCCVRRQMCFSVG